MREEMSFSKYKSNQGTTHFARIARALLGPCIDVLREVLAKEISPPDLERKVKAYILQNKKPSISEKQKQLVYSKKYSDFDITLLYFLFRNICSIPPHKNKWGKDPEPTDKCVSANIERVRISRNEWYGHATDFSLSDSDFKRKWNHISQIVKELEGYLGTGTKYQDTLIKLKTCFMDPESIELYIDTLLSDVTNLKEGFGELQTDVTNLKEGFGELQSGFTNMKEDVEEIKIKISSTQGVCRQCRSKLIHLDYKSKPVYVAGACDEEYTQPQHSTTNKLQISTDNESPNRNVIPSEDGVDKAYCSNQLNSTTNKLRISTDGESPNRIVIPSKDGVDLAYCSNHLKNLRYVPFSQPPPELENDSELDEKGQQSSQGSCWLPGSQDTDTSDLSEEVEMSGTAKRKALDDFAEKCGLSPIKKQMKINWSEASDRTRSDYLIKTQSILKEVANVLAPCKQIAML